ncbi:MAG: NAD(P)-dependent oxidoreductase [Mollicutes bacterium]|nr:NAD(P)-dependent oxidoreductase [Mollicutes bacterium]
MKKVLITGAGGMIGVNVIKHLLSDEKYEITALDFKNKKTHKFLNPYKRKINVVYGDILDPSLVDSLVKETDYIIHLASCLPPIADYKKGLSEIIDYDGTNNIIRAINLYNPKCTLIYSSTTSLYKKEGKVGKRISLEDNEYYNQSKFAAENLIKEELKNYTILRVPLVLGDLRHDHFIYNIALKDKVEVITKEDVSLSFVKALYNFKKINRQILNIGGGTSCQDYFGNILINILKCHGISFHYIFSRIFLPKDYRTNILLDSEDSNKLLNYQNDTLTEYYNKQKRRSKLRKTQKFFAKISIFFLKRRMTK